MPSPSRHLLAACLLCAAGLSCSGSAAADQRWGRAFVPPPVFDDGIPRLSTGTPLRGAFVDGEWRMHLGAAHRSGLRDAPAITAPRVAWSAQVGIQGYTNTPLVTADVVFVTSQGSLHNQPDDLDGFYALRKSDGEQLWHTPIEEDVNGGVLTDELIVAGGDSGTLYAVRRSTGALVWSRPFGTPHRHAPLPVGDELWVSQRDGVHRISIADGSPVAVISSETNDFDGRGGLAAFEDAVYRLSGLGVLERLDGDRVLWDATPPDRLASSEGSRPVYGVPLALPDGVLIQQDVGAWGHPDVGRVARYLADGALVWDFGQHAQALATGVRVGEHYEMPLNAGTPWLTNGVAWSNVVSTSQTQGARIENGAASGQFEPVGCSSRAFASIAGVPNVAYLAHHKGVLVAFSTSTGELLWIYAIGVHAYAREWEVDDHNFQQSYCSGDPYDGTALFATPAIDTDGSLFVGSGEGWLFHIVADE